MGHLPIPQSESGHMVYLNEGVLKQSMPMAKFVTIRKRGSRMVSQ